MNVLATVLLLVVLTLAAAAEWWRLRSRFMARLREVQEHHQRDRRRASEALGAARRQIASLQHQLTGARLKAQRAGRQDL